MKSYLWTLPFISFLVGYFLLGYVVRTPSFAMPNVLGNSLKDAVLQFSQLDLNVRILDQKEESDVEPGTVLEQNPYPGQNIKKRQPVFLVIAQEKAKKVIPNVVGYSVEQADVLLKQAKIRHKFFALSMSGCVDTILAQSPQPDIQEADPVVIAYVCENEDFIIVPDLRGCPFEEAQETLQERGYSIQVEGIASSTKVDPNAVVVRHQPLPGSIIRLADGVTFRCSLS